MCDCGFFTSSSLFHSFPIQRKSNAYVREIFSIILLYSAWEYSFLSMWMHAKFHVRLVRVFQLKVAFYIANLCVKRAHEPTINISWLTVVISKLISESKHGECSNLSAHLHCLSICLYAFIEFQFCFIFFFNIVRLVQLTKTFEKMVSSKLS